jgi:hypothetical protein
MANRQPATYKVDFRSFNGFHQVYNLSKTLVTIGSQTDADISFPGLEMAHAEIHHDGGAWILCRRHPGAEIRFRGHPVQLKKLNPGERVYLGAGILTFLGDGSQVITAVTDMNSLSGDAHMFSLNVLSGSQKGRIIPLPEGEYTLGRYNHSKQEPVNPHRIEFHHRYMSRCHTRIFVERDRLIVEDLQSTNGTRINGRLIKKGELRPGDSLKLGKFKLGVSGPPVHRPDSLQTVPVRLRDTTWKTVFIRIIFPILCVLSLLLFLSCCL